MNRCRQCGLTERYEFAEIDGEGACKYCRGFHERAFKGQDGLIEDLDLGPTEAVGATVSGGKDSIFMWGSLVELLGKDHVTAFCYYRPGITSETAMANIRKTQAILGTELVVLTDSDAYGRFRRNLEILLDNPRPEMVRVLLCAGCRYGITKALYKEGLKRGVQCFVSGASYLELAPFKEELIAACSPSNDLDDGFRNLMRDYPEADYGDNLFVMKRDNQLKYKSNDTAERSISVGEELRLFDFDEYFENDPDRIEEVVTE